MLKIVILVTLVSLMLWSGLQCRIGDIREVLRDYGFIAKAILLSVVGVPLLALGVSRLLTLPPDIAMGIMLMAVAGGVPFLPLTADKAKGEHRAAVTLVFLLAAISVITAPITVNLVEPKAETANLPVGRFIVTLLISQLMPLLIGMLIAEWRPALADTLTRVFKAITTIAAVVFLVLIAGKVASEFSILFGTKGILAIVLVVAASMVVAWFVGAGDGARRPVLTDAIGLRNPGMAVLIANASFAGVPIVVSAIIVYLVVQMIAGAVGGTLMKRAAPAAG